MLFFWLRRALYGNQLCAPNHLPKALREQRTDDHATGTHVITGSSLSPRLSFALLLGGPMHIRLSLHMFWIGFFRQPLASAKAVPSPGTFSNLNGGSWSQEPFSRTKPSPQSYFVRSGQKTVLLEPTLLLEPLSLLAFVLLFFWAVPFIFVLLWRHGSLLGFHR